MVDRLVNSEANSRRISMVESCFGSSGQALFVAGRVLVGEGVLTKMCRKKPKPRQFFLFNDILVYGNIVLNKKKYNKQHIIPLEEVQLSSLEDDAQFRNGWLIKTPTKSFAVYAATATEKAEWMAHINKCVTDLLKKSGKKAAEKHAAVWVPDSDATICQHCKRNQFTVINRRHHCRKCGQVVCGPCSNKRVLLPHQSDKPLRVCLTCFDEISASRTGDSAIIPGTVNNLKNQDQSIEEQQITSDSDDDDDDDSDVKDELANDSSADEDSNDEGDDSLQEPPSQEETMTFYGASNGNDDDAPLALENNNDSGNGEVSTVTQ